MILKKRLGLAKGKLVLVLQERTQKLHLTLQKEVVVDDNGERCGDLLPTHILEGLSLLDLASTIEVLIGQQDQPLYE